VKLVVVPPTVRLVRSPSPLYTKLLGWPPTVAPASRLAASQVKLSAPLAVSLPLASKLFATAVLPGGVTDVSRLAAS